MLDSGGTQEYSPDLTIKLTDKEYNQYVKKVVKILHKVEKRDGIQRD
ncbi:MAG: hypothetical protein K0R16_2098 [Nitrososphaeraceae archaeon]|nr:hypothetical protein [Nitrososphaeraceae archaeon]